MNVTASYQYTSFSYGQSASEAGVFEGMAGQWSEPSSSTRQNLVMVGARYLLK